MSPNRSDFQAYPRHAHPDPVVEPTRDRRDLLILLVLGLAILVGSVVLIGPAS